MSRARTFALVLAGAFVAAGCSTGEDRGPRRADPGLPEGEIHYVAMGDSFTSGPALDEARTDPFGCGRSTQNYPAFLADWLDVATYTDVSCAGATTDNVANPQLRILDGATLCPLDDLRTGAANLRGRRSCPPGQGAMR